MSAGILDQFFNEVITVQSLQGSGAYGSRYGIPAPVVCFVDDGAKLVRNAAGEEVVASATIYAPAADAALFVANSQVTLRGRTTTVVAVAARLGGALGLPDHVEVHLS